MTPIMFTPLLLAYLYAAGLIVWCAVIDVSRIEGNPEARPVGWCSAAYRARQGYPDPSPAPPVELPDWAAPDWEPWADRVAAWLFDLLDPEVPEPAPVPALLSNVVPFPVPPPARTLNRYAGAVA